MKANDIALIGGLAALGVAVGYYFIFFKPGQAATANQLTQANDSIAATQNQPSVYEGKLIRSGSDQRVYIVTNGYKQLFTTLDAFNKRGYSMNQVLSLPPNTVAAIPTGPSINGLGSLSLINNKMFY